jgi:hypothetical protein
VAEEAEPGQSSGQAAEPAGDDRVGALADRVDKLTTLVERFVSGAHGASQDAVQDRLAAPDRVAQIVRDELARTDAQARDEATRQKVESHAEVLAKLTEKTPVEPQTRRSRIMFGAR